MITAESVLRRRTTLCVEEFDDAVLLWDPVEHKLHHLDLMSAVVWEELDGRSLGTIAEPLARDFDTTHDTVTADLITLGERLVTEGLVDVEPT